MKIDISDHLSVILIKDNLTFDTDVTVLKKKLKDRFNITYSEKEIVNTLDTLYLNTIQNEEDVIEQPEDYYEGYG